MAAGGARLHVQTPGARRHRSLWTFGCNAPMKVKIQKVGWIAPEIREGTVTFSASDTSYQAFSCGPMWEVGAIIDVEFHHLEGQTAWHERFSNNAERKKCLIQTDQWSYDGFGQIVSIRPVIADFGALSLALGDWTHDERVVGEYIFWRIARLDIFPREEPDPQDGKRP